MKGCREPWRKVFVQLYRDGLIYKDKRLVNWDPKLQTAISDLEVAQVECRGSFKWSRDDGAPLNEAALAQGPGQGTRTVISTISIIRWWTSTARRRASA